MEKLKEIKVVFVEQVLLNNYNNNTGIYFNKYQATVAYNKLLDHYDPNRRQDESKNIFNWDGFWSLISTKNSEVTGIYLSDTMDRDIFYKSLKSGKK